MLERVRFFKARRSLHCGALIVALVAAIWLASTGTVSAQTADVQAPDALAAFTITVDRSDDPNSDSLTKTCGFTSGTLNPAADGCTLRRALIEAGARPAGDRPITIKFGLASNDPGYDSVTDTWTLTIDDSLVLKNSLSSVEKNGQVIIDGSTQPGGRMDGPKIMVNTKDHSLEIEKSDNIIRGLGFYNGGVIFLKEDRNTVEDVWMGLSKDGQSIVFRTLGDPKRMAGGGIHMSSDDNLIQRNVIAGSFASAIIIDGSDNNVVTNNAIGTRADETVPLVPENIQCIRSSTNLDPANWYGGWGISVSGSNNQILQNRIVGLHRLQSANETPPRAIEVFGSGHLIKDNVIGVDKAGKNVGVCGQGIKVSGSNTDVLNNLVVRSRADSEDAEEAAILGTGSRFTFGQISVRRNVVKEGPGEVYAFGAEVPDTLRLFEPAKITKLEGLVVSGTSGDGSPCPGCTIDLYLDNGDGNQEALQYMGSATADGNGDFSITLAAPLPDGQGIRTGSTTQSSGVIGNFGAGTSTKLSKLYLPLKSISIDGPTAGKTGVELEFDFNVLPATSEQIYTYSFEVTDESLFGGPGDSTGSLKQTWTKPGPKTIAVTVSNGFQTVKVTHEVEITEDIGKVTIGGPTSGTTGNELQFTIGVLPEQTGDAYTYKIEANDQTTINGSGDSSVGFKFTWDKPGTKTITVTVSNGSDSATETYTVEITGGSSSGDGVKIYLPAVIR